MLSKRLQSLSSISSTDEQASAYQKELISNAFDSLTVLSNENINRPSILNQEKSFKELEFN